ncbi:MAG: archease [Nitrososphaeria archaeon]
MPRFYKMLDHVSDAFVEVTGASLEECFSRAGLAVVDLMVDLSSISRVSEQNFEVEGFDLKSLLYNFLEQVLVKVTSMEFLPNSLEVKIVEVDSGYVLTARGVGEMFLEGKHKAKLEVKAVTYHLMEIYDAKGKFVIRFLLDL